MIKDYELSQLIQSCVLSEKAHAEIKRNLPSELFRRMRSTRGNVGCGSLTCKMMRSIRLESIKIELQDIYQIQHDDDALEYYEHPP